MALDFLPVTPGGSGEPGVVRVTGSLTLGPRLLDFGKRLAEQLSSDPGPGLILDVAGVEEIDSAGLGELVILYTTAGRYGRRLCLVSPSPRIINLLRITRLSGILPHFADEAPAVSWVTGRG